jgi:methionyl aminopeptidase
MHTLRLYSLIQPGICIGDAKKKKKKKKPKKKKAEQSEPPRVGLSKLFPSGVYPTGEIQEYKDECVCHPTSVFPPDSSPSSNNYRTTSEEKRHLERLADEDANQTYSSIRRAAEVHRQVRRAARQWIQPGRTMTEIANYIEDGTRALVEESGLESGVGFPTGLSLNHCAAHYTPNAGDTIGACGGLFYHWRGKADGMGSAAAGRRAEGRYRRARQGPDLRLGVHAQL